MKNERYASDDDPINHILAWNKMSEKKQNEAIMNPHGVDEGTWEKAKKAAAESGHAEKWPLVMYIYQKMMGK